jgi:hypothetical protein
MQGIFGMHRLMNTNNHDSFFPGISIQSDQGSFEEQQNSFLIR